MVAWMVQGTTRKTRAVTSCSGQRQCPCCPCCSLKLVLMGPSSCALTSSSRWARSRCISQCREFTHRTTRRQPLSERRWRLVASASRQLRRRAARALHMLRQHPRKLAMAALVPAKVAAATASTCFVPVSRSTSRTHGCRRQCYSRRSRRTCSSTCATDGEAAPLTARQPTVALRASHLADCSAGCRVAHRYNEDAWSHTSVCPLRPDRSLQLGYSRSIMVSIY
jgi:hypothetical protein